MPPDLDRGDQQVRTGNLDGRRTGIKKLMSVKGLICGCFAVKLKMEEYKTWNNIRKGINDKETANRCGKLLQAGPDGSMDREGHDEREIGRAWSG